VVLPWDYLFLLADISGMTKTPTVLIPWPFRATLVLAMLMLTLLSVLAGCGGPSEAQASEKQIEAAPVAVKSPSFTVINESGGDIRAIAVRCNLMISFRALANGESSTMSSNEIERTSKIAVRWTDANGEHHFKSLDTSRLSSSTSNIKVTITRDKAKLSG